MTVRDVADRLGVSHTTIKKWVEALFPGEPDRDSHGRWRLTPDHVRVLETVKALRAEDKGINTITRIIRPVNFTEISVETQSQPDRTATEVHPQGPDLRELIRAEVSSAIQSNNDLAEKYAHAAHRIGELEAEVRHLTTQAEQATSLLSDRQTALQQVQERAARAESEVQALRLQLAAMETQAARPWWRKLIG